MWRGAECCHNSAKSWVSITSRVPQESVLGPVLFPICIYDINCAVDTKNKKFADDTKLYGRIKREEQALPILSSLARVMKWSNEWKNDIANVLVTFVSFLYEIRTTRMVYRMLGNINLGLFVCLICRTEDPVAMSY